MIPVLKFKNDDAEIITTQLKEIIVKLKQSRAQFLP